MVLHIVHLSLVLGYSWIFYIIFIAKISLLLKYQSMHLLEGQVDQLVRQDPAEKKIKH